MSVDSIKMPCIENVVEKKVYEVYELPHRETVDAILSYLDREISYAEQRCRYYSDQTVPVLFGHRKAHEERAINRAKAFKECETLHKIRDKMKVLTWEDELLVVGTAKEVSDNLHELKSS